MPERMPTDPNCFCCKNMFTRIAERLGILDVLAPRSEIKDSTKDAPIDCNGGSPTLPPQEALDETIARKFQAEEDVRYKKIRAQYEAERQAERLGSFSFAKKQRVLYHHKAAGKTHPAVVVAVHYDDGPNKPYYVSFHSR